MLTKVAEQIGREQVSVRSSQHDDWLEGGHGQHELQEYWPRSGELRVLRHRFGASS